MVDGITVIAVDGPAAGGKGTLARRLARHFGYAHLDTGLLYRAAAKRLLDAGADPEDARAAAAAAREAGPADPDAPGLRSAAVSRAASAAAAHPGLRRALLGRQRAFAAAPPGGARGAVLDGRDIGTVVCPYADHKIFVTAAPEVRAARRCRELRERGCASIYARVLRDMEARDARDRTRRAAPLAPAGDAFVLDTSAMDADEAFAAALAFVASRAAP